jgi:uncharacterized protein (DUF4415 family)
MISDEPDEDADTTDDDSALDSLPGDGSAKPEGPPRRIELANWPTPRGYDIRLNLDAETVAWFRATYPDWRRQMYGVLRAWMTANTTEIQATQVPSTDALSSLSTKE